MKSFTFKQMGGGVDSNSSMSISTKSYFLNNFSNSSFKSSKFFRPIVASSLALFLGTGLVYGEAPDKIDSTGPKITLTGSSSALNSHFSWDNACGGSGSTLCDNSQNKTITWQDTNNAWTGTITDSPSSSSQNTGKKVTELILKYNESSDTSGDQDKSFVSVDSATGKVSVLAAYQKTTGITADFQNKDLGTASEKINLNLNFTGQKSVNTKNITITNLKNLYGNLTIGGNTNTTASDATSEKDNNTYKVTLDSMEGDIRIWGSNYVLKGTVDINKSLKGNIYLSSNSSSGPDASTNSSTAAITVNFKEGATMTGNIVDRTNGYAGIRKDIYFKGAGTVFTGNIASFGTDSINGVSFNKMAGNRIFIEKGDIQGNIIAASGQITDSQSGNTSKKGLNVAVFGNINEKTNQNLTGGILASDIIRSGSYSDDNTTQATNVVILADKTTLNIKGNGTQVVSGKFVTDTNGSNTVVGGDNGLDTSNTTFDVYAGSIVARNFGVNEVRLYTDTTLNLNDGKGYIASYILNTNSSETSTLVKNASTVNKINFLSSGGVINGSIAVDNSRNTAATVSDGAQQRASGLIYVGNNASGTITGNLSIINAKDTSITGGSARLEVNLGTTNYTQNLMGDTDAITTNNGTKNTISDNSSTLTLQGQSNTITKLIIGSSQQQSQQKNGENQIKTANLVLDSSKNDNQTTIISGDITNNTSNAAKLNFIFKGNKSSTLDLSSATGSEDNIDIQVQGSTKATINTKSDPSVAKNHTITFTSDSTGSLTFTKKAQETSNGEAASTTTSTLTSTAEKLTIDFKGNGVLNSSLTTNSSGNIAINVGDSARSNHAVAATINGNLTTTSTQAGTQDSGSNNNGINITFGGSNASLTLNGNTTSTNASHTINTLTSSGANNTINLSGQAYGSNHTAPSRDHFQTLTINKIDGTNPINFILYVNPNANNNDSVSSDAGGGGASAAVPTAEASTSIKADRIIIEAVGNGSSTAATASSTPTHYLAITGDASSIVGKDLYTKGSDNNIALATVKNSGDTPVVNLQTTNAISGFSVISFDMVSEKTDKNGKVTMLTSDSSNGTNTYTTYFLGSAKLDGTSTSGQKTLAAAMGSTYDLYLANMNSLNKRMGELRDNPKGQGVWARVFTGLQTSKFALQTNSFYTTIQGGYDYAFGFNGANNYLGIALSYANSITGSKMSNDNAFNTSLTGINSVNSNAVEFAIYNAYVQDGASSATGWKNGLYTDSIIKFSYINSSISLKEGNMITNSYATNSFAFTLSQEVGYRFILGQTNEWYIDPQAELAFGYFDQSNFTQKLSSNTSIDGIQDSILTLRGRIGSNFGYKFDKFTEGKNFKAQAYLGTYFVGDYIAGGSIDIVQTLNNSTASNFIQPLNSTARFTLNLGTNIAIKDDHRIYFDFERSFGGSIITQYQFNLGYRYSFGESKYTPYSGVSTDMSNASDTIKEVTPSSGYYIKALTSKKASKKELRVLKGINNLKTQNIGDSKSYLIGPFKSIDEAKNKKNNYEGVLKELKSEGEVIEVE